MDFSRAAYSSRAYNTQDIPVPKLASVQEQQTVHVSLSLDYFSNLSENHLIPACLDIVAFMDCPLTFGRSNDHSRLYDRQPDQKVTRHQLLLPLMPHFTSCLIHFYGLLLIPSGCVFYYENLRSHSCKGYKQGSSRAHLPRSTSNL